MAETLRQRALGVLRDLLDDDESPVVERFADAVGRSLEQLRQYAGMVRFLRPEADDQLVAQGAPFELVAPISALRGLVAERVRFYLDDELVGDCAIEAGAAFFIGRCDRVGIHTSRFEALGPSEAIVQEAPSTRVQVVDEGPVVLVDAHAARHVSPVSLRALVDAGAHVAWLRADAELEFDLANLIEERDLPRGAVLTHLGEGLRQRGFGLDLQATLLRTLVRRMRASGVAITAVVSDRESMFPGCREEAVMLVAASSLREIDMGELRDSARTLHERRRDQDPFRFRLDEVTRTTVRGGNRCAVELDNGAARRAVFDSIDQARRSVEIQLYIVEEGRFMDFLGAHLIAAARRGVHVRVLVDALYSRDEAFGMSNPILRSLREEPGIEVRANDPVVMSDLLQLHALKERDHRKLVLVDGARAYVSGRNAGDLYYTGFDEVAITDFTPYERIPWLDAHIEVVGPLVEDVRRSFEDAWTRAGGEPAEAIACTSAGDIEARLVIHDGVSDANGMAAYEALFDAAQSHVLIVNDFPIVSTLVGAARRAIGRGVRVCLLTGNALPRKGDGTFFRGPIHRELFEHMTKGRLEPLVRRGLELYEYATPPDHPLIVCTGGVVRPYVHAKLMTADGKVLSVGSANLDATASFWEREANVVVHDEAFVGDVERWIFDALDRSHRVDVDDAEWLRESGRREIVARLWPDSLYS